MKRNARQASVPLTVAGPKSQHHRLRLGQPTPRLFCFAGAAAEAAEGNHQYATVRTCPASIARFPVLVVMTFVDGAPFMCSPTNAFYTPIADRPNSPTINAAG